MRKITWDWSRDDSWTECSMKNRAGTILNFSLLLLVIPFEENGTMETFLLNAIGANDSYDKSWC